MKCLFREVGGHLFVLQYRGNLTDVKRGKFAAELLEDQWVKDNVPTDHYTLDRVISSLQYFDRYKNVTISDDQGLSRIELDNHVINVGSNSKRLIHVINV